MSIATGPTTDGVIEPDLDGFLAALETDRVVPVVRRLLADGETPISAYRKLAGGRPGTFLLESAEGGGVWSRYSFIGVQSAATLSERDGKAVWTGIGPEDHPEDPLAALHDAAARLRTPRRPGLPPLTGGLVGYLGYDAVRRMERLLCGVGGQRHPPPHPRRRHRSGRGVRRCRVAARVDDRGSGQAGRAVGRDVGATDRSEL
jgi:anthranilate synthase component 1